MLCPLAGENLINLTEGLYLGRNTYLTSLPPFINVVIDNEVSDKLFENGLCLPSGSNLTEDEFNRIFNSLDTIFSKHS